MKRDVRWWPPDLSSERLDASLLYSRVIRDREVPPRACNPYSDLPLRVQLEDYLDGLLRTVRRHPPRAPTVVMHTPIRPMPATLDRTATVLPDDADADVACVHLGETWRIPVRGGSLGVRVYRCAGCPIVFVCEPADAGLRPPDDAYAAALLAAVERDGVLPRSVR